MFLLVQNLNSGNALEPNNNFEFLKFLSENWKNSKIRVKFHNNFSAILAKGSYYIKNSGKF